MKPFGKILIVLQFAGIFAVSAQQKVALKTDGTVPIWLTSGPYEVETVGFGSLSDKAVIDENKYPSISDNAWRPLSTDKNGYTDIKEYYGWKPFTKAEKLWYEKIVYAYADIYSTENKSVELKFGGNTIIQISLNGEKLYNSLSLINAQKDEFTKQINLRKGENHLLLKVANSHENHSVSFFVPVAYDWGFYLRLSGKGGESLQGVSILNDNSKIKTGFEIKPTFFYKRINGELKQKYLVEIISSEEKTCDAQLYFNISKKDYSVLLKDVKFGLNEKEFYIAEPKENLDVKVTLKTTDEALQAIQKNISFRPMPKYELYFMPTTHMDIGYTNPQPIVIERQLKTLDEVIEKCSADKNFRWTIETMWLLENYRLSRSKEKFLKLIELIKSGRVAVSPIYTNPFTGWISETEMLESFRLAGEYKEKYGISYFAAIYNDVPGQSWALPQALRQAGVKVLVDGLNELFSNYKYQRSLPKVSNWLGSAKEDTVMLYLTEAYTEGLLYGLERDSLAIENRTWHRINGIMDKGYPFNKILINGAFTDNAGIAYSQYNNALKWNEQYEYPKFIISTINDYFKDLLKENLSSLKTIRGDWTSDWDILHQGETKRMLKYRWIQNNLPQAEILSSISNMTGRAQNSFAGEINSIYKDLLHYSGHGSGLEYGYGTKGENMYTDEIREGYVQEAYLKSRELLERTAYRLTAPKESFDSHGVVVFNTLSWSRIIPVTVELKETDLNNYSVYDLANKCEVSSIRLKDKLYFLASDVPGIGYKQYELITKEVKKVQDENKINNTIENEYYKLTITDKGISIREKSTGENILNAEGSISSFMPLRKRFQTDEKFLPQAVNLKLSSAEKNGVFEELTADYNNDIFKQIKFRLWKNLKRIDIKVFLNLSGQKEPERTEEYGLPFAFNAPEGSRVMFETLGGLLSEADRFEAAGHNYFSIRRVIDIKKNNTNYLIASPDCRIFVSDTIGNKPLLIANLLNNFPKSWNRNEDKEGVVEFNFSIAKAGGGKFDASGFGYEVSTDPVIRRSWYKKEEPLKQFVKLSNPFIKLLSIKPVSEDGGLTELILQNTSPDEKEAVTISADSLFAGAEINEISLLGETTSAIPVKEGSITIEMFPNSIKTIMVKNTVFKPIKKETAYEKE